MAEISQDFSLDRLHGLWALAHPNVTWRHDVDYDVRSAALMAAEEQKHGIRSTYYVRLRAPEYNPFARITQTYLHRLAECGHRVGLHLDLGMPRDATGINEGMIAAAAAQDYEILAQALPELETVVSLHAPPRSIQWTMVGSFESANDPYWQGRYIADSRGVWREEPEKRFAGEPVMVGLHSEWWFLPEPQRSWLHARETAAP